MDPEEVPFPGSLYRHGLEYDPPEDASPVLAREFGRSRDSHWMVVTAESPTRVATEVAVSRADGLPVGQPFYETAVELAEDAFVAFRFRRLAAYSVAIRSPDHDDAVRVDRDFIDCNRSYHAVLLTATGAIETTTYTTLILC